MSDFLQHYSLRDEFLTIWSRTRLASMTLDDHSQAGSKDSFTYWIESRLDELGSIWGGSSFKFGVLSRKDTEEKKSDAKLSYSETHGWYSSLGSTAEAAFIQVRCFVTHVADWAAQPGSHQGLRAPGRGLQVEDPLPLPEPTSVGDRRSLQARTAAGSEIAAG
ncbi:hypothetical protein [Pseudomonas mosselii]|uniref:Uncharacterized protein n=1 Tax=Pseudomonas mosselii TaxID=78327 RepID=A0AA42RUJ9_9PSED|nr:hypothetical protein [Pseudomonas mosselii]MDH1630142.1 hypothetical protein [Pseudomonas mosselii]